MSSNRGVPTVLRIPCRAWFRVGFSDDVILGGEIPSRGSQIPLESRAVALVRTVVTTIACLVSTLARYITLAGHVVSAPGSSVALCPLIVSATG